MPFPGSKKLIRPTWPSCSELGDRVNDAHERVRSISTVMDGLERAVLLLNALPGHHPIQSYPSTTSGLK